MDASTKDLRESASALLHHPSTDRLAAVVAGLDADAAASGAGIALQAELLRRQGRLDLAAPLFATAIERAPDLVAAYHCAALNAIASGRRDAARALWHALLARDPGDSLARYHIGLT